jgi:hypothetical protein
MTDQLAAELARLNAITPEQLEALSTEFVGFDGKWNRSYDLTPDEMRTAALALRGLALMMRRKEARSRTLIPADLLWIVENDGDFTWNSGEGQPTPLAALYVALNTESRHD